MEVLPHNNDMKILPWNMKTFPNSLNPSLLLLEEQQTIYSYTLSPSIRLESNGEDFSSFNILIQLC